MFQHFYGIWFIHSGRKWWRIYQVLYQKQQNDREKWNMIDSSFITTLPDTWAINKRFIMLAVIAGMIHTNGLLLGGMTSATVTIITTLSKIWMLFICQNTTKKNHLHWFLNTAAYQETIGGYGGLHHCLIPQPKHILIDRDKTEFWQPKYFSEQQTSDDVLENY